MRFANITVIEGIGTSQCSIGMVWARIAEVIPRRARRLPRRLLQPALWHHGFAAGRCRSPRRPRGVGASNIRRGAAHVRAERPAAERDIAQVHRCKVTGIRDLRCFSTAEIGSVGLRRHGDPTDALCQGPSRWQLVAHTKV
jgi:hypothetical protein